MHPYMGRNIKVVTIKRDGHKQIIRGTQEMHKRTSADY
jgi:hypothetical protein